MGGGECSPCKERAACAFEKKRWAKSSRDEVPKTADEAEREEMSDLPRDDECALYVPGAGLSAARRKAPYSKRCCLPIWKDGGDCMEEIGCGPKAMVWVS